MKIGIVGANGFVGSRLLNYLKYKFTVSGITRNTVDILNCNLLRKYLQKERFDCIIICAATMNNDIFDIYNNLGLMLNFHHNRDLFGKLINTASGAEYDRSNSINNAKESSIFSITPTDFYGLGQNLRSRLCINTEHFYNLRIFNCFGVNEIETRLFPSLINGPNQFNVYDDRLFDYFSIHDLCTVVDYFITETPMLKDVNCVYENKNKISDVARQFNEIHKLNKIIKVISNSGKNYTGNSENINSLGLKLMGLQHGLENYFKL